MSEKKKGRGGRPRKPRKIPLTRAQKTATRLTFTLEQAEEAAYESAKKRVEMKALRALQIEKQTKERLAAGEIPLGEANPLYSWGSEYKRERGYDPVGFMKALLGRKLLIRRRDASGEGMGGIGPLVLRDWQKKIALELLEHRRTSTSRWLELLLKPRQLGYSTFWSAFIWADLDANSGASAAVTAHQDKTLKALNQNYRTFLGREKAKEDGKARRMADAVVETMRGSRVELLSGNDSLGRGGSYTHVHVSEGDYIPRLNDAMDSVLASMVKSEWATGVVESTIRRGSSTEFKAMVEQTLKEQARAAARGADAISFLDEAWKVRFISWLDDETARLTLTEEQARLLRARVEQRGSELAEYELELIEKHNASIEQVAWWHRMCKQDARGDVSRMVEMYPVSLNEALTLVVGASFFRSEAIEFYQSIIRPPLARYRVSFDGLQTTTEFGFPTLDIYREPQPHHRYVIGADPAWADNREGQGSMCYFVLIDTDTGDQAAEMYGHMSPQDFAVGIWRAAQYYNDALVVPEVGPGTGGPDDYLRGVLGYHNVYEREKYGRMVSTLSGVYGFRTDDTSRGIVVGRLQNAFNECKLGIYSRTLLDHVLNLGRHNGMSLRKNRMWRDEHDDGAMATALCLAPQRVHMLSKGWHDKRMKDNAPRASGQLIADPFAEWLDSTREQSSRVSAAAFSAWMDG